MLTDFQKKKLYRTFQIYDSDRDGIVSKQDYERAAHNVVVANGFVHGSPQFESVTAAYLAAWEGMRRMADQDNDGRVSLNEHLTAYDHLLANAGPGIFVSVCDASLNLIDQDRDGKISRHEYVTNLVGWAGGAITAPAATDAFHQLDVNHDGFITRDEMLEIVRDFFTSDDPTAHGNWLVGPLD
jgi:Ca2+-binding EF-hand superfamily protein